MKRLIFAVAMLLTVASCKPPEYEFITVTVPDNVSDETLNRLGADGWNMVSTRRATLDGTMLSEITMKREKSSSRTPTTSSAESMRAYADGAEKRIKEELLLGQREKAAELQPQQPTEAEQKRRTREELAAAEQAKAAAAAEAPKFVQLTTTRTVPVMAQVYLDGNTMTYFREDCEHPTRAVRTPKSAAIEQGYSPAPSCYARN